MQMMDHKDWYSTCYVEVEDLDALLLLNPFLEVIRSGNTTGPIAGTALGSIEKFLHYGIVGKYSKKLINQANQSNDRYCFG